MKKIILVGFSILVTFSAFLTFTNQAMAVSGPCYFTSTSGPIGTTGTCSEPGLGDYGTNDIFTGRTSASTNSIFYYVNTKTELIDFIVGCYNQTGACPNNNRHNRIGAGFTVAAMLGIRSWPSASDVQLWVDIMSSGNVETTAPKDATAGDTSWYDNDKQNTFFGDHPNASRDLIRVWFTDNGGTRRLAASIERECGNLLAGGIPLKNAQLSAAAGATPAPLPIGTPFSYSFSVSATRLLNVGGSTFRWRVVDDANNIVAGPVDTALSGGGVSYNLPRTFNTPGQRCYTIQARDANTPPWVQPAGDGNGNIDTARQCATWYIPQSATLSARAGGGGPLKIPQAGSASFTFRLWVEASNTQAVGADTFNWQIQKQTNGGAWTTSGVPAPSSGTNGIVGNGIRYGYRDIIETYSSPVQTCYRITLTAKPGYAVYSPQTSPPQCVNAYKDGAYYVTPSKTDYEKGGTAPTVTYRLYGTPPCGPGSSAASVVWGGTGISNVTTNIPAVTSAPYSCPDILRDQRSFNPPQSTLDGQSVGPYGNYVGTITSPAAYTSSPVSLTIYEAPFARFFGNDVNICGSGADNRFVYDNRASATPGAQPANTLKGSFAEYATIYQSTNTPATNFSGLNSATNGGFPDRLRAIFGGNDCSSGLVTSGTDADFINTTPSSIPIINNADWNANDRKVIFINGSTTITTNIVMNNPAPFDPDTHPVLVIYATGDINVGNSNVTRIDAILISETAINTCTQNGGTSINADRLELGLPLGCKNPLKINGALIAPTINLQRSGGTRYFANTNSATWMNVGAPNDLTTASEIVEFPWYLNFINIGGLVDKTDTKLDAYFALPPRL